MGSNPSSSKNQLSWPGLTGIILLQSVSGTHSIFSAYAPSLAKHFSISPTRLNYLMVALDTGKVMGWFSSAAAKRLPLWTLLFIGLFFGSVGYGVQYLCATAKIHALSYWQLLLLNVIAGNSSCWINTYCELISARGSPMAAISSSYSGLSGKMYTSLVEGIRGRKGALDLSTYLLLSFTVPATVGLGVALLYSCPMLIGYGKIESVLLMFLFAFITGVYSVCESMVPMFKHLSPELRAVLLLLVIMFPLSVPLAVTMCRLILPKWKSQVTHGEPSEEAKVEGEEEENSEGNEHELKELLMSVNFWLYYWVNASGSTLAMVYLNNLGHISESRGRGGGSFLLATSSAFGFFGRFLCIVLGWYTRSEN